MVRPFEDTIYFSAGDSLNFAGDQVFGYIASLTYERETSHFSNGVTGRYAQGSVDPELRLESARALLEIGFEGYAIGGLAVGEGQAAMLKVLDETVKRLPEDRPRGRVFGWPTGSRV